MTVYRTPPPTLLNTNAMTVFDTSAITNVIT